VLLSEWHWISVIHKGLKWSQLNLGKNKGSKMKTESIEQPRESKVKYCHLPMAANGHEIEQ
jgi:hypothetical protein